MDLRALGINTLVNYNEKIVDNTVINKIYMISNPQSTIIKGIPDGCIDLQIVQCNGKTKAYLAGSHMQSTDAHIMKYEKVFGVKFQPGTEIIVLEKEKFALDELVENRCDITELFDMSKLLDTFENQGNFQELQDIFCMENVQKVYQNCSYMVSFLVREVEKEKGNLNISELIEKTGYSQRYVNQVCKDKLGFSIKKFASIVRMQSALDLVKETNGGEVCDILGYYDQAHFVHDFKNFTSVTPKKYQKMKEEFFIV